MFLFYFILGGIMVAVKVISYFSVPSYTIQLIMGDLPKPAVKYIPSGSLTGRTYLIQLYGS